MTTIRCPICDAFLDADGEAALTVILRAHLGNVHDLHPDRDVMAGGKAQEHHPQLWEEMKRGTVPTDEEVGEDVEDSVLCPFCGERIRAHAGDDLTSYLRSHLQDAHGIPTLGRSRTLVH